MTYAYREYPSGRTIYHASAGEPVLSSDMTETWGYWREDRHSPEPRIKFTTTDDLLGIPSFADRVDVVISTRTKEVHFEKGLWVCHKDVTQDDLAKCPLFLPNGMQGPASEIAALEILIKSARFKQVIRDARMSSEALPEEAVIDQMRHHLQRLERARIHG